MHESIRNRLVAGAAERNDADAGAGLLEEPRRAAGSENGGVRFAVTVIITRRRQIARSSEREREKRIVLASLNKPFSGRGSPNGNIGFAVTGVIALHGFIRSDAKTINLKLII